MDLNYLERAKKMKHIQFSVEGIPPIKSKQSIWSQETQAERLVKLRLAALNERKNKNLLRGFITPISIEVHFFAPPDELNAYGDLTNMVGGVSDGLQTIPNNPELIPHEIFRRPEMIDISPEKSILYKNDSQVWVIIASKNETEKEIYYTVKINELNKNANNASARELYLDISVKKGE